MPTPSPSISFVIPTFNFAQFLPDTLDSLVDEGHAPIEIIVFDGGSSDDTLEVLAAYRRTKFPDLKVIVATTRGNIDIDLNQAVAAATGDYVWTMSADDTLMPGWSRIIADRLERLQPDLLLVPAVHCDIQMRPRRDYPILRDTTAGELVATLADDDAMIAYLGKVRSSEGLFSFCSACIVRRDSLADVPVLEQANGTCWRYSARLVAVLARYPSTIVVLDRALLKKRGENDSFSGGGIIRRLRIATTNWDLAIGTLVLDHRVRQAMLSLVKSDIRPTSLVYLSQFIRDDEEQGIYDECVRSRLGEDGRGERTLARVLLRMPRLTVLKNALLVARPMYRSLQRRLWDARLRAAIGPIDQRPH